MEKLRTIRGYDFAEATSAMQKAIRRGDARTAGYFGMELYMSGYREYVWRRLFVISAEDCWGVITNEIAALADGWKRLVKRDEPKSGRIFVAKAIILLCLARKCRDADHLTNLAYDATEKMDIPDDPNPLPVPEYALDCHTEKGRRAGKTKADFFVEEFTHLHPRQPGLFDDLVTR